MTQTPQPRDSSSTNNRNNHGVIGGSGNFVNSGKVINRFNITQVNNAEPEDVELDRLLDGYTSKDALHNSFHSPPECYSGTRKTVRKEIREWIDNSSSAKSPFLWLNGPAGVGKSVIAKTIAESHDQVVATFLFSTSSDRSAATLFPTLAWQLARRVPETKQHIIASLKNNGSLLTSEIKEQFDHLIVQSLKKCTTTPASLPVMIIDGLDECTDEYMLSRVLEVLVRVGESGEMPLRFIICSRPEPRIRCILKKILLSDQKETEDQSRTPSRISHSFRRQPFHWHWRLQTWIQSLFPDIKNGRSLYTPIMWGLRNPTLLLQEARKLYRPLQRGADNGGPPPEIHYQLLDRIFPHPVVSDIQIGFSEECKGDIARYLESQFNAKGHQLGESDIFDLVGRSCGQFLYASTIVRLLEDSDPKEVLEMVHNSSLPTPNLNKLYNVILKRAKDEIRNRAQEGGPNYEKELGVLTDTLAILVVFAENVHFFEVRESFVVIESLVGLEKGRLTKKLFKMNSVLNIVTGKSISVYHRSFLEFLQAQQRSGEHHIAYPKALRRFLVLLSRAGLRYFVMDWFGRLQDDDRKRILLSSRQPSAQSENHMIGDHEPENHQQVNNYQGDGDRPCQSSQNHQQLNNHQGDGDRPSPRSQIHQQLDMYQSYPQRSRQWLHNYVARWRLGQLSYEDFDSVSPTNMHHWISKVQLNEKTYGQGEGSTKSEARERAAAKALAALKHEYDLH